MNRGKIGDNAVLVPVVEIVLTSGIVEQREILALDEDGQAGADINHMDLVMRADEGFAAPSDDESPGLANIAPRAVGQFDLVPAAFFADDPSCIAWQIGRASCRERVCQYVSISVDAASLQKKTK